MVNEPTKTGHLAQTESLNPTLYIVCVRDKINIEMIEKTTKIKTNKH